MKDWREHLLAEATFRQVRRMLWLPLVLLFAYLSLVHLTPHEGREPSTKLKVVTPSPRIIHRRVQSPPEPRVRDCIGCMTAKEFASIRVGQSLDNVVALFGEDPGNAEGDGKSFWRAVSGGIYWVYWKDYGCDKDGSNCLQRVASKRYTR